MISNSPLEAQSCAQRLALWIPFLLVVATVACFSGILRNDFTLWDDQDTIAANPNFNPPSASGLIDHWRRPHMELYVPLTYTLWWSVAKIAWRADDAGGHLDPRPFHAANLLLHVLTALVVYALLRRILRKDWPAAAGALLFALHPVQVEAVAWISGTKDLLGGLLVLTALWQYVIAFSDTPSRARSRIHYALATLAMALALLAKPVAVVTPLLALVIDRSILKREWRQIAKSLVPWIALVMPCVIWTKLSQPASNLPAMPLWQRPLIAADALAFYMRKLVIPIALAPDYGRRPVSIFLSGSAYWTWIAPLAIAAVLWWRRRGNAPLIAGALLSGLALLPVLGLVRFDFQTYSTTADHYLYLPMCGVALVAAWMLSRVQQHRLVVAGAGVILVAFAIMSTQQTRVWRDTPTLFSHTIAVTPDSYAGYSNLATFAYRQAQDEAAAAQLATMVFDNAGAARHRAEVRPLNEQYLAMAKESYRVRPESIRTRRRVGDALLRLDRPKEAVPYLREAVAAWEQLPSEDQKRRYGTTPHLLGVALLQIGQPTEAAEWCERTLTYLPDDQAAQRTLSAARAAMASVER